MSGKPNTDALRVIKEGDLFYIVDSSGNKRGSYTNSQEAQDAKNRMTAALSIAGSSR